MSKPPSHMRTSKRSRKKPTNAHMRSTQSPQSPWSRKNTAKRPPRVNKGIGPGRNDPCPCGKTVDDKTVKFKRCCLGTKTIWRGFKDPDNGNKLVWVPLNAEAWATMNRDAGL